MSFVGSFKTEASPPSATIRRFCLFLNKISWLLAGKKLAFGMRLPEKVFPIQKSCFLSVLRYQIISSVVAAEFISDQLAVSMGFIIQLFYAHLCEFCL